MARKAGQGEEEEVVQSQEAEREKTPVRHEEKKPACHGGAHHVVEQGLGSYQKVLIGVLVTLLLLFFLLLLLILFRYQHKCKEKKADQQETNLQLLAGDKDPIFRDRLPQKRSIPDAAIKEENL
ncbi:hypothetical protein STEG23_038383, partial [Scotinomys teguina]